MVGGRPQIYEINSNPDLRSQAERPNRNLVLRGIWAHCDETLFRARGATSGGGGGTAASLSTAELTAFRMRFWRNYGPQRY